MANWQKALRVATIIYSGALIATNIVAQKLTNFFGIEITADLYFFPLTYIIADIMTEIYGFNVSRKLIFNGLLCNCLVAALIFFAIHLPPSPNWEGQEAFSFILGNSAKIFIASVIAYLIGEFCNSYILHKLKIKMQGKYFVFRALASSFIGELLDSIIFCVIAFSFIFPTETIVHIILVQFIFKFCYEIVLMPLILIIRNSLIKQYHLD